MAKTKIACYLVVDWRTGHRFQNIAHKLYKRPIIPPDKFSMAIIPRAEYRSMVGSKYLSAPTSAIIKKMSAKHTLVLLGVGGWSRVSPMTPYEQKVKFTWKEN